MIETHLLWLFQVLGTDLQEPHGHVGKVVELLPGVGGQSKVVPAVERTTVTIITQGLK